MDQVRYMDDLLLIDRNLDKIRDQAAAINQWLINNFNQQLNAAKTGFTNLSKGITYLGYRLLQTGSPKEPLQVFPEPIKKWQLVTTLRQVGKSWSSRSISPASVCPFNKFTGTQEKVGEHQFQAWNPGPFAELFDAGASTGAFYRQNHGKS